MRLLRRYILGLLVLLALPASAQFTNVSALVQDANGNAYVGCRYSVDFVYPAGGSGLPVFSGTNTQFQTSYTGAACDSSGNLAIRLPANTSITPASSQWKFSICSSSGQTCFTYTVTITGVSQSISAGVQAAAAPLPINRVVGTVLDKGFVNLVTDCNVPTGDTNGSGASANANIIACVALYPTRTLLLPGTGIAHITANLSISNPITVMGGGGFYRDNGVTLTMTGTLDAPTAMQVFYGPGAVKLDGGENVWIGWFGGAGDGKQANSCSITSGTSIITCAAGQAFSASDVGKVLITWNYGTSTAYPGFSGTTITGYNSPSSVTVAATATNTISGLMVVDWGTDNLAPFNAAVAAKPCGTLRIPPSLSENVAYGGGPTVTSGITYPSLGGDYLFSDHIELGWPLTSACNGFTVEGVTNGTYYGASPALQFPMQTGGGIWVRSEIYGARIKNLQLIGSALFRTDNLVTYTPPGTSNLYDPRMYYYNGITGQGEAVEAENVEVYGFAGNGIITDGACNLVPPHGANTVSCQPDFWRMKSIRSSFNRGCGFISTGGDSNSGVFHGGDIQFNGICGVQESSSLSSNTYTGVGMHGNSNNAGIAAGTTQAVTSNSVTANVATVTSTLALTNNIPQLGMWVTLAGQLDASFNGTCRIASLPASDQFTCPFTHADGATTGGTVQTASSTNALTARDALLQAAVPGSLKAGPWRVYTSIPTVLISPYMEANQPCPQNSGGMLIIGGNNFDGTATCIASESKWPAIAPSSGGLLLYTKSGSEIAYKSIQDGSILHFDFLPGIPNAAGGTVEGTADIRWFNRAQTLEYTDLYTPNTRIGRIDNVNGGYRQYNLANGSINLNPKSGQKVSFQNGSEAEVASVSTAGLGTFNGGVTTPAQLASTVVTGTAPLVVASTTQVANLNASQIQGLTFTTLTDTPGAITVNSQTCTERTVAFGTAKTTATVIPVAQYALDANIVISSGAVPTVNTDVKYRICNPTGANITLNAAAAFNLTVIQ